MELHVALVVDVDGVLSPVYGSTSRGDDADGRGRSRASARGVSLRLNAALDDLAARPEVTAAWLTSWGRKMRQGVVTPPDTTDRSSPTPSPSKAHPSSTRTTLSDVLASGSATST